MERADANLADLATMWSRVFQAQESQGDAAASARNDLLVRYHEAVYHYLRDKVRDPHAADKLFSNFALRVLEADKFLKRADPERGRFRDYLKTVLRNMVTDHYRGVQRDNKKVQGFIEGSDQDRAADNDDEDFVGWWRQELANQAWKALDTIEQNTGQPYAALLRHLVDHPGARSAGIAESFSAKRGKAFTAAGIRQLIHRARELFGDLLVQEVARSLNSPGKDFVTPDRLEQELIELNLLNSYCKDALERYAKKNF